MSWIRIERDLRDFFYVLVGCCFLLSARGLYRYSIGYPELTGLAGTMQDRNDLSLHLMMVAPVAYCMLHTASRPRARLFLMLSLCAMIVCVLLTFSRMGFLMVATAAGMFLLSARKKWLTSLLLIPIGLVIVAMLPETFFKRMETIVEYEEDASAMGRITAWHAGIGMGIDNVLTGVGLKCFELPHVYSRYASDIPHVAHNAYIQMFAEAGLPGFVAWFSLVVSTIVAAWKLTREAVGSEIRWYGRAVLQALTLYLLGSIFLNAAYFELPYVMVASLVVLRKMHRLKLGREITSHSEQRATNSAAPRMKVAD